MAAITLDTFSSWLAQAQVPEQHLTPAQRALLQAAFRFRQNRGTDYYSSRLLSHFLLHCGSGLKVASLARLVGVSRPTASRQQGLSSKHAIQQAHHRMDGRPLRQAPAALRRTDRCLPPQPARRHARRFDRLHRPHLWRARLPRRRALLPQALRPRSGFRLGVGDPAAGTLSEGQGLCRLAAALASAPLLLGRTQYAGAFLLMPQALSWLATARARFADEAGTLQRGLLTSVFALVIGLERVWHLNEMEDLGFALLTGGRPQAGGSSRR